MAAVSLFAAEAGQYYYLIQTSASTVVLAESETYYYWEIRCLDPRPSVLLLSRGHFEKRLLEPYAVVLPPLLAASPLITIEENPYNGVET
eukprot:scaffold39437_cov261-Skeletonema_dohrnii-CCMP3373.AAC.1